MKYLYADDQYLFASREKPQMNVAVSFIALIISAVALVFGVFTWRDHKRQDKRDLFLQLHERLHDVQLQRGRRILYQVCSEDDAETLFQQRSEDYDFANKALWMLDIAALYAEQGYVDRELFMQEWGFVYVAIFKHGRHFIDERVRRTAISPRFAWPHFQSFAQQAVDRDRADGERTA
jgi:hypothetical protein